VLLLCSGKEFQIQRAATAKARLPTVDSRDVNKDSGFKAKDRTKD